MKILEALNKLLNDPTSRDVYYGICANLRIVVNSDIDKKSPKLDPDDFLKSFFIHAYGKLVRYPIELEYTKYALNYNKWDISTEYGAASIELLKKMITFAENMENLPNVQDILCSTNLDDI